MTISASAVGLVFPGDSRTARTWSGTPSGLARGFEELGLEVRHTSAELPRPLALAIIAPLALLRLGRGADGVTNRLRASATAIREGSREIAALRSRVLAHRLPKSPSELPLIQIGTGYTVPAGSRVVTFEDMTVVQAVALDVPEWRAQSETTISLRIERQGRAYEQALACCVASGWAAQSLRDDYGVAGGKVHVVGLGRNHEPRPVSRDWTSPRFLFVGLDFDRKGGSALLHAFDRLRARVPSATLDVVGGHPRLDRPGVTGHGFLSPTAPTARAKLDALFESSTCCVMPSLFEPFGIVHAEAAAAGVPSIGTTAGGPEEVIGADGGILVPPGDGEALWEAMVTLSEPEAAARMGTAALERSARFTWPAVAGRVMRALERAPADRARS